MSTNKKIVLTKGIYKPTQRSFYYELDIELDILDSDTPSIIFIMGENGAGKSTFIEQVIIQKLKESKILYKYIGQDWELQNIVNRSMEAIISIVFSKNSRFRKLFKNDDTGVHSNQEVLLLDEVDKSLSDEKFWEIVTEDNYRSVVIISHNTKRLLANDNLSRWKKSSIFEIYTQDDVRKVRVMPC